MTPDVMFGSFFLGGFEGSTMKFPSGRRVDAALDSGHVARAAEDYGMLAAAGIRCVREALAWHRIEHQPGQYDWSQLRLMQRAAQKAGVRIIWDLCHYGWPDHLDFWSDSFVDRFAAFAEAAARTVQQETDEVPVWVPVNEISFWTWAAATVGYIEPVGACAPVRLKRRLVAASIAAIRRLKAVDARARLLLVDPVIHVAHAPDRPADGPAAEAYRLSMYEAWDMIAGYAAPELGGSPDYLDLIGINYYAHNQWVFGGEWIPVGSPLRRPLTDILEEVWSRYRRPLVIAETGMEGAAALPWLTHICDEVRELRRRRVPVEGICVYPIMDYPGWDDDRHCPCGVIGIDPQWSERHLRPAMTDLLRIEAARFAGVPTCGAPRG